ncbi:hypothetical protein [Loktanella agnita]|uniref:hypothetical protein n=1 Tax=Loktanella agnita TaxID=287097 RepID=UPI0039872B92
MQIAFHIGANCTDEDRLLKSVLKNADTFLQSKIAVPGPGRYRRLIRETIQGLERNRPDADTRDALLDAIIDQDDVRRVLLSNDNFMCVPNRIFESGLFYAQAEPKVRGLHRLFPQDEISLFMGIRNPVSFLQETQRRADADTVSAYLGLLRPEDIRWSDVVRRIKTTAPDTPLTVWCNEDTPLLWETLIRRFADVPPDTPIKGRMDMLSAILTPAGIAVLTQKLKTAPPQTEAARHDLIAAIWEDHAVADAVEDEIDLPELHPDLVARMTQLYDEDLDRIAAMEGVTLLLPFA